MKSNKKNIVIYFLEMLIVFIILDLLMTLTASLVGSSSLFYKYGDDLIVEIFYAFSILIVMLLFKNSYVFTEKKERFWDGVLLAVPMLLISIYNFIFGILSLESYSIASLINMLIFCVFVGIAEEFLCRGWLQNEFIERFSSNKKEIIISIILSSLIFGFMHLVNLSFQNVFETILQIINATSLGFLLGCVYYKTKNIWSVIFLHAFYDAAIMIGQIDMIKDCTYNTPSLAVSLNESIGIIIVSLFWILGSIYILNKCDFKDKKKHNNKLIGIALGFLFLIILIPTNTFISGYDNYRVCYSYKETNEFDEYTMHFPSKKEYSIEYIKNDISNTNELVEDEYKYKIYKNEDDKITIINLKTNYKKEFNFNDILGYEVFESNDSFNIVVWTEENESTLYFSKSLSKSDMSDEEAIIDNITFKKYAFPELSVIGYIDNSSEVYPYAVSADNDKFIIMNDEIFVIK